MPQTIDYYFPPSSPFAYLGHDHFVAIAHKHGAKVAVKPVDFGEVFSASGGLPLAKRAPQRQAYRLVELRRWAQYLNKPMNVQPQFFPVGGNLAATWILAASELDPAHALTLAGAVGRAIWEQERNVADAATMELIAKEAGLPAPTLAARAQAPEIAEKYAALTQEAVTRGVFGAPTYVVADELFWGQDRLDFLDRKLAK